MRLVTFQLGDDQRLGLLRDEHVIDLNRADPQAPSNVLAFLASGADGLALARRVLAETGSSADSVYPLASVKLCAPIPRPPKILCSGTFHDHLAALGLPLKALPSLRLKPSSAVIGPGDAIVIPVTTQELDYENELAVVIGRRAKGVAKAEALDYVAGYTILNDASARDLQFSAGVDHGKNFDTSAPMGPYIALVDEIPDPGNLAMRTWVNSELRQNGNTRSMGFDVATLISSISRQLTLEPGDVISTGTPCGTGMEHKPSVYLKPGDRIRMEIEGLGTLENHVVAS